MKIEMVDCVNTILREIAMPEIHQKDIAQSYALALRSSEKIDWAVINKAIIDRWSMAGLKKIKTMAYDGSCFND